MRLGGFPSDPPCECNMQGHKPFIGRYVAGTADNASRERAGVIRRALARVRASARLNAPSRLVDRSINVKWPSNGPVTQRGCLALRICKRGQLRAFPMIRSTCPLLLNFIFE